MSKIFKIYNNSHSHSHSTVDSPHKWPYSNRPWFSQHKVHVKIFTIPKLFRWSLVTNREIRRFGSKPSISELIISYCSGLERFYPECLLITNLLVSNTSNWPITWNGIADHNGLKTGINVQPSGGLTSDLAAQIIAASQFCWKSFSLSQIEGIERPYWNSPSHKVFANKKRLKK
jgi:hypothetical protein